MFKSFRDRIYSYLLDRNRPNPDDNRGPIVNPSQSFESSRNFNKSTRSISNRHNRSFKQSGNILTSQSKQTSSSVEFSQSSQSSDSFQTNNSIMWKQSQELLVVLSSDDDDDDVTISNKSSNSHNEDLNNKLEKESPAYVPINPKEPVVIPSCCYQYYERFFHNAPDGVNEYKKMQPLKNIDGEKEYQQMQPSISTFTSLDCRTVRIGSYKVAPKDRVIVSTEGVEIIVPPFSDGETEKVSIIVKMDYILKILGHFGSSFPVFFIYVTDPLARDIRQKLKMVDKDGFYFDPCSQEESQKRITILLDQMRPESVMFVKNFLNIDIKDTLSGNTIKMFEELSQKDANEILVKSSPVEVESLVLSSKTSFTYETKTLLVFPPPPIKGGISISMNDYLCLNEEQFLNDVLVDFYLKWLHMCHLSDEDRERTHVFSTFFYKRLTAKPKSRRSQATEEDQGLSPAQRRHWRVKSWTKNVDIFTKDFLLIPINEHAHWFLAIICFPSLEGFIRISDGKLLSRSEVTLPSRSSTRQRKKVEIPVIDDADWSDRDEAEGDDNEMEDVTEDDFDLFLENDPQQPPRKKKKEMDEPVKQPCILIFDSLSGETRARIVATLRDYLSEEHEQRKGKAKVFSKETMPGACPKVPQQMNYSDCGLFTLQFAQSFFERPLQDFRLPIKSLADWFNQQVVGNKRAAIAQLIQLLMDKHKPNHGVTLPPINFGPATVTKVDEEGSEPCEVKENEMNPPPAPADNLTISISKAEVPRMEVEELKSVRIKPRKMVDSPSNNSNKEREKKNNNNSTVVRELTGDESHTKENTTMESSHERMRCTSTSIKYLTNVLASRRTSSQNSCLESTSINAGDSVIPCSTGKAIPSVNLTLKDAPSVNISWKDSSSSVSLTGKDAGSVNITWKDASSVDSVDMDDATANKTSKTSPNAKAALTVNLIENDSPTVNLEGKNTPVTPTRKESSSVNITKKNTTSVNQMGKDTPRVNQVGKDSPRVNLIGKDSPRVNLMGKDSPRVNQEGKDTPKVNLSSRNTPLNALRNSPSANLRGKSENTSLQLLCDSYGGSDEDSEDEIFLLNNGNSTKTEERPFNKTRSPISFSSVTRCKR